MKRIIIGASILLNVVLMGCVVTFMMTPHAPSSASHQEPVSKIAILTPVSHPSLEKIEQGFKEALVSKGKGNYQFSVFNANGNKQLLHSQADEIVRGDFDLIFTIATQPAHLVKELCTKKQKTTPVVFAAVSQPEELGIVQSLAHPGGNVTGVTEDYPMKDQIDALCTIKPAIKTILLVYNPTQSSGLEAKRRELEAVLQARGIVLSTLEVYATNEVYVKAQQYVRGVDAVMVLKDNTVVTGIDGLIKLCNTHGVTLFTSDLDSGDKGAALSFGVHEDQFGVQAARLAIKILDEGEAPAGLACLDAGVHKVKINTKTMRQQGLDIATDLLNVFKAIEVM